MSDAADTAMDAAAGTGTIAASRIDPDVQPRPSLGVVALAGRGFVLLRDAFVPLVVTSLVIAWLRVVGNYGLGRALAGSGLDLMLQRSIARATLPSAASVAASAAVLLGALLVHAASHVALLAIALRREAGEPVRAAAVVRAALRFLPAMVGAYVAVVVLTLLGFAALIVPGLWLVGVYAVVSAVIVAEDRRRGYLGRTRALTKDYRWPLAGLVAIIYLVAFGLGGLAYGVGRLLPLVGAADSGLRIGLALLVGGLTNGLAAAYTVAVVAVAYRRLRAIKEGGGAWTAVFE